ncbi:M23 family metallopeptidase [Candidatus Sumerlaeota bacterium]|nr:M23 family metallopeptidase [Candidatus Sumerlaeota bacterium]
MLHRVVDGDCLSMICQYYRRDASLLVYLNQLRSPYLLHEGDFLYIPPDNNDGILRSGVLSLADIQATRDARGRRARTESKPAEYLKNRSVFSQTSLSTAPPQKSRLLEVKSVLDLKSRVPFLGRERDAGPQVADAPPQRTNLFFSWPAEGRYVRGFSLGGPKPHKGVDIAAPRGTRIFAAEGGKVLFSGSWRGSGYGNLVVIDHGGSFSTLYGHCSKVLVASGQMVEKGDPIALVGATGRSTGNHLHFEVRYKGIATDPEKYLPERNGRAIALRRAP